MQKWQAARTTYATATKFNGSVAKPALSFTDQVKGFSEVCLSKIVPVTLSLFNIIIMIVL